jgi:hypothetical protein
MADGCVLTLAQHRHDRTRDWSRGGVERVEHLRGWWLRVHDRGMVEVPERVRARVRHEPDRSCTVLVSGPQGEVVVGTTTRTDQVLAVAREGAARVFGVSELGLDRLHLSMPQPPYGRDGQTVRITSVSDPDDPSERELLGAVGQVHWFSHESAWFVTVPGSGTGIHPGEELDFEPVVSAEEAGKLKAYLHLARRRDLPTGDGLAPQG